MGKRLVLIVLLLAGGELMAQSFKDAFEKASKDALVNEWEQAKLALKPHLFPPPDDTLAPAMMHLYALACEKTGDRASAIVTEEKILSAYPAWGGQNEVQYFLGELALKQRHYFKAMTLFSTLPEDPFLPYCRKLIARISLPKDTLESLKRHPALAGNAFIKALTTASEASGKPPGVTVPMKIGVVLPFQLNELQKRKQTLNPNPALDFYRGILLASEVLHAADSALEVFAFDTRGEKQQVDKLLDINAFNGLDVVIGPLKVSELQALADWSKTSKTPCINPLSNHLPVEAGPLFFSQQPSFATLARNCFEFVTQFSTGKKVGIVFGPEKNDSLQAEAYRSLVLRMGREVSLFKKVGKNSAANLTKFLLEADLDSTCHLFVPDNEPLVRAQLLGAYGWLKAKYPIVVVGRWLESHTADFDEWARNPIYFATSDLPDYENHNWKNWANSYKIKWGSPPNWVAWKGFDLAITLSRSWYMDGRNWATRWKSGEAVKSELFGQYRFTSLQPDNQFVPVYQVVEKEIKPVWPK